MKFCRKTMGLMGLASIIILGFVISSAFIQSFFVPEQVRISPGQKLVLSVHYPLGFQMYQKILNPKYDVITRNLVLNSGQKRKYQVVLKLFGSIPLKKMEVEVAAPTMVIPGGQAIGVVFSSRGVVVVGMLPVTDLQQHRFFPAKDAGLKAGDVIVSIDDIPINHVEEVEYFIHNFSPKQNYLHLTVQRNHQFTQLRIRPVLSDDGTKKRYMLGIYVDDPAAGVGTLSFYEPNTMRFAGLGHQIAKIGGRNGLQFEKGEIVKASISGIRRGMPGKPGEKIGVFNGAQFPIGQIKKNTRFGIYGSLDRNYFGYSNLEPIPAAFNSQITEGDAEIYTVLSGSQIEKFKVKIIRVFRQQSPHDKGMIIKVTDPVLLRETGGIVQGMSGSPIVQNGRLVGAVTHVFVNDPTKGYGVLAEWMLKEMFNQLPYFKKAS